MFTVSTLGIETIDLENAIQSIRVVDNAQHGCHPFQVRKRGPDIIFSDLQNRKIYKYTIDSSTLDDFAGSGNENSVDGPLVQCSLRQSCEIDMLSTQRTQCQELLALYLPLLTLSNF